jgi:hypothetical protein
MAPDATKWATREENRGPDARSIVDGIAFNVKYYGFHAAKVHFFCKKFRLFLFFL